jgi:hypothetical protein
LLIPKAPPFKKLKNANAHSIRAATRAQWGLELNAVNLFAVAGGEADAPTFFVFLEDYTIAFGHCQQLFYIIFVNIASFSGTYYPCTTKRRCQSWTTRTPIPTTPIPTPTPRTPRATRTRPSPARTATKYRKTSALPIYAGRLFFVSIRSIIVKLRNFR